MGERKTIVVNISMKKTRSKHLRPGLLVTLYDEEMEVEATVEFETQNLIWLGRPNWASRRDLPCSIGKDVRSA